MSFPDFRSFRFRSCVRPGQANCILALIYSRVRCAEMFVDRKEAIADRWDLKRYFPFHLRSSFTSPYVQSLSSKAILFSFKLQLRIIICITIKRITLQAFYSLFCYFLQLLCKSLWNSKNGGLKIDNFKVN